MLHLVRSHLTVLALGFAFPLAVRADLTQTNVLTSGSTINLDTGVTGVSGGDIQWTANGITPEGNATAVHIYDNWPLAQFQTISILLVSGLPGYSNATIAPKDLRAGSVIGIHSNGGHWAKLIVTATAAASITVEFTTFGVAAGAGSGNAGAPTITSVVNNSSFISSGLPNSGIAPSSIFAILGSGLADAGLPVLQDSTKGLPLSLNGATISVTVGGVTTHPVIYYTSPNQIAAVLPTATPTGTGTITVTHNGVASNAETILIVPSALGIDTFYTNSAAATDAVNGQLLTYTNSGTPGQTIVLWTTGLGADSSDSDTTYTTTPHPVNSPLTIYIGGAPATILYQGSAGYPGVNQINLIIPASAPNGCWISVAGVAGGLVSNLATIPVNSGGGPCYDQIDGIYGNQISPPAQQTLRTGLVTITQSTTTKDIVSTGTDAAFESYTGVFGPVNSVSPGGCIVKYGVAPSAGAITGLDPGSISLTGPNGISLTMANQPGIKGAFFGNLAANSIPQSGGMFVFKGTGGADVGTFTSTVTFANPLMSWTNRAAAAAIDRSQGFTATWTGGNPGSFVLVSGSILTTASTANPGGLVAFYCWAPAADGRFTVPAYILSALPAGTGSTQLQNGFSAPISASGIDIGIASGGVAISAATTFK